MPSHCVDSGVGVSGGSAGDWRSDASCGIRAATTTIQHKRRTRSMHISCITRDCEGVVGQNTGPHARHLRKLQAKSHPTKQSVARQGNQKPNKAQSLLPPPQIFTAQCSYPSSLHSAAPGASPVDPGSPAVAPLAGRPAHLFDRWGRGRSLREERLKPPAQCLAVEQQQQQLRQQVVHC
jgi:hypothetical protein